MIKIIILIIYKYNRIKADKLKQLQETPLVPNPNGTGNFVDASEQGYHERL
jgi:hypothetical protein